MERQRLDIVLSQRFEGISRRKARALIDEGCVFLNGRRVKVASKIVDECDKIEITSFNISKEIIFDPAWILYRDKDIIAINKPPNIPVQETRTSTKHCLIYLLKDYLKREKISNQPPPFVGLCHRIDAKTSGLVLFALNPETLRTLNEAFSEGIVEKNYLARVEGIIKENETVIDAGISPIHVSKIKYGINNSGKHSITEIRILDRNDNESLLEVTPITGRTHQIRVHLSSINHPISGDTLYGAKPAKIFGLHSYRLKVKLGKEIKIFLAPVTSGFWKKEIP